MKAFIQRHPVASYFLLAIVISWGGIMAIILPGSIPASPADAERLFVPVYLAMLLGPSVAGLAVIAVYGGAVPKLLTGHGLLATGVGVGLVWGAWHFLAIYWGSGDSIGSVPVPLYLLVALFSFLPPYRILMTWVYRHTRSLFVGILMHASLTSSMLMLGAAVSGRELLIYDLTLAAAFWIAAALVLALEARHTRKHAIRIRIDLDLAGSPADVLQRSHLRRH